MAQPRSKAPSGAAQEDAKHDNTEQPPASGGSLSGYEPPTGSVTEHTLETQQGPFGYTARAEWMVLRSRERPAAELFHVAYEHAGADPSERPLTFVFNGGPGAASAFLHMGAVGPRRVLFNEDGTAPPPPPRLADNHETWLTFTDVVFVDPVGTGFSRTVEEAQRGNGGSSADGGAASGSTGPTDSSAGPSQPPSRDEENVEFFGLKRDLESLAEFIRRYLSRHRRWRSPVFIAGESYGGFRVGKLAKLLQERYGVGLSGAILISPALEFMLLDTSDYDVLGWVDRFPTMAAAAAFHGRSGIHGTDTPVEEVVEDAAQFATEQLTRLLTRGESLPQRERTRIVARAARYLGLPRSAVDTAGGRIPFRTFARKLLADQSRVCGIYDATITTPDPFPDRDTFQGPDPTLMGTERVFAAGINAQLRETLGIETEREYHLLSTDINEKWRIDYDRHVLQSQIGATDDLRYAMSLNPYMHVYITHGYYDLITPAYSSTRIAHLMKLDDSQRAHLTVRHYGGGHMFYTWGPSRAAFRSDIEGFYNAALRRDGR